jgi:multiple antibiotic resistance protein
MHIGPSIQILISLFVLVNPLEGIPFFLSGTSGHDAAARAAIARRAATAVTIILLASAGIGAKLLALFGIGLPAFQIGGGIILFLIAVQMTLVGVSSEKSGAVGGPGAAGADIAIVPLAIPLLGGPGAISGAILYGTRTHSLEELGVLCGLILVVGLATYVSLRAAEWLRRILGETGINIATRLMGLLIAGIAAQLIIEGIEPLVRH